MGDSREHVGALVRLTADPRVMVGVRIRGTQTLNPSQTGLKGVCVCGGGRHDRRYVHESSTPMGPH